MGFDLTGATSGAASGASAGSSFGPYGTVIGAVVGAGVGGVLGGKSRKAAKSAARMMREARALDRFTARRMAIVNAVQQKAILLAAGEASGYNPEGTSSVVGTEQSITSQIQSNLKTEAIMWHLKTSAENKLGQAAKYDNMLNLFNSAAKGVGDAKNAMGPSKLPTENATANGATGQFSPMYSPSTQPDFLRSPLSGN